jgi:hypothetical protein
MWVNYLNQEAGLYIHAYGIQYSTYQIMHKSYFIQYRLGPYT